MTRIDEYKQELSQGEIKFLDEYLPSLKEFLQELNSRKLLLSEHPKDKIETIQNFIRSSNAPISLLNSFYDCINPTNKDKIAILESIGFEKQNLGEQIGSLICHSYQVAVERFKLQLLTLVDFSKLNLPDAHKMPVGPIFKRLQEEFPKNKYITFYNTTIRNSVTHYTYYFSKGDLYLCQGYFDSKPQKLTLAEFMIESKKLIVLVESFILYYLDMYSEPGHFIKEN